MRMQEQFFATSLEVLQRFRGNLGIRNDLSTFQKNLNIGTVFLFY